MTDRIEPALTQNGWKHARANRELFATITLEGGNDDDLSESPWDWDITHLKGDAEAAALEARRVAGVRGAIAALNDALPDDHPGKITRALVKRLRESAASVSDDYSGPWWLSDLADALESYLPPE